MLDPAVRYRRGNGTAKGRPFSTPCDRWKMAQVFRGEDVFREMEETAPLLRCCPSVSPLRCARV